MLLEVTTLMATTGFVWIDPPEKVFVPMTQHYVANLEARILAIVNKYAPQVEAWMKANHPWQNRTGAAEAGLHTEVEYAVGQMVRIILSHGVDYGIWLEVLRSGANAVIGPAVDVWSVIIWDDIQALLR